MTVLLWVLVAMGVWWVAGREQDAKLKALSLRADTAQVAFDTAVTVLMQARGETRSASHRERDAVTRVRAQLKRTDDSLKALTEVLVDSAATITDLRRSLSTAIQTADTLAEVVTQYVAAVDSLKGAYALERRAATVAVERAEQTIKVQDSLIRALQTSDCRLLGRPCPSRTNVLLVGTTIGVLATLLTIR